MLLVHMNAESKYVLIGILSEREIQERLLR